MQQQQEKQNGNGGLGFLKIWALTLYLPLRKGMGRDHVGFSLLFACPLIFMVSEYARAPGLMWLLVVDVIAWFIERIGAEVRRWRGVREHSEYGGQSWLLEWMFGEDGAKQLGEPMLCFFIGWLIYKFTSQPNAATYFWYGGVIMALFHGMAIEHRRKIETRMTNAMIEHQGEMARLRSRF